MLFVFTLYPKQQPKINMIVNHFLSLDFEASSLEDIFCQLMITLESDPDFTNVIFSAILKVTQ